MNSPTVSLPTFPFRIGLGDDVHRIDPNQSSLTLGGVRIDCGFGLIGHSDADVLLHAITDALLGAATIGDGYGDIGEMFPDTDSSNRGRDSVEMLHIVQNAIWTRSQYRHIVNIDVTIHAERPKIQPLRQEIRSKIAEVLRISPDQVSVKAKTGEKVGPVGRGEAISATAVVLMANDQY
ncbi:MAG: 2-C-methyl-D-erythritol 2,4-cyclodiphosphate synthase [Planctomycetia bacterium]|nr:2-C-methyl-D-erythritol 2,4-cyclodiphosphate synthase [Planctomycetia bacterium]